MATVSYCPVGDGSRVSSTRVSDRGLVICEACGSVTGDSVSRVLKEAQAIVNGRKLFLLTVHNGLRYVRHEHLSDDDWRLVQDYVDAGRVTQEDLPWPSRISPPTNIRIMALAVREARNP